MRTAGIATTIAGGIVAITGSVMLGVGLSNSHMDMLDLTGIFITPLGASAVLTGVPLWMIGDTSKRRRSSAGAWGGTVMTTLGVAMVMAGAVFLPMGSTTPTTRTPSR